MDLTLIRTVAARGLFGLGESLVAARRNDRLRPLLRGAWGPRPVLALGLLAVAAGVGGVMLEGLVAGRLLEIGPIGPALLLKLWRELGAVFPVLLFASVAAWRIRRVLRRSRAEILSAPAQSFRALALPLVPAAALLVVVATLAPFLLPAGWPGWAETALVAQPDALAIVSTFLLSWLAHGAGLAACVATLAGRRSWPSSLIEIAWRYLVFRMLLLGSFIAIGVMSGLAWGFGKQLLGSLLGWRLPASWAVLLDRLMSSGFAALVFLALIGGAWLAAEQCFPRLLRTGDVHFLRAMAGLFSDQAKPPKETVDPSWPGVATEVPAPEPSALP